MTVVLDTAGLTAADALAYWNDVVAETFVPSHVRPARESAFRARVTVSSLGAVELCTVDADAEHVDRTRAMIARSTREAVMVGLLDRGGAARVTQHSRQAVVAPGELVLYDSRSPFVLDFDRRFRLHVFVVPHHCLGLKDDEIVGVTGRTVPASGAAALVPPLLRRIADDAGSYAADVLPGVGQAAADLLTLALRERLGNAGPAEGRAAIALVSAFVDRHLGDPDLNPAAIARAQGMSVRSLHKLFEAERTTVARYVQERRLDQARRALSAPEAAYRGVTAIAHLCGFRSAAHFSRSFRAAFGVAPSKYRAYLVGRSGPSPRGTINAGTARAGSTLDRPDVDS